MMTRRRSADDDALGLAFLLTLEERDLLGGFEHLGAEIADFGEGEAVEGGDFGGEALEDVFDGMDAWLLYTSDDAHDLRLCHSDRWCHSIYRNHDNT